MVESKVKSQKLKVKSSSVKSKVASSKIAPKAAKVSSKPVKMKAEVKVAKSVRPTSPRLRGVNTGTIEVDVMGLNGKAAGKIGLPKEIFGAKVNDILMAQAVRVYLANQRVGMASTKTRGEVTGTTKKVYKQKGTGRARHGAKKAPIFVGGGITFGPKPRDFTLSMPKKMKRGALFSALTSKLNEKTLMVVDPKQASKTREIAGMLKALLVTTPKKVNKIVFVTTKEDTGVTRASRNVEGVRIVNAQNLTTYDVLNNKSLLFAKNAVDALSKLYIKE